jgi:hypothetical protein
MGVMNITSFQHHHNNTQFYKNTHPSDDQYGMGKGAYKPGDVYHLGKDPLVKEVKRFPFIGHDFYRPDSMPPWAQRTDPRRPGRPQPITKALLRAVLKRNYYSVFYPEGRNSLAEPAEDNEWAVMCPTQKDN